MPLLFLFVIVLALGACEFVYKNPTFIPAGYTYHNGVYKAPPGRSAPDIGYIYSQARNQEVIEGWTQSLNDLLTQLESEGLSPQNVYVEPLPVKDAFTGTYDHALREVILDRGYSLLNTPGEGLHIRYDAYLPMDAHAVMIDGVWTARPKEEDMVLVLTALRDGLQVFQAHDVYHLPTYGLRRRPAPLPETLKPAPPQDAETEMEIMDGESDPAPADIEMEAL